MEKGIIVADMGALTQHTIDKIESEGVWLVIERTPGRSVEVLTYPMFDEADEQESK